MRMGMRSVFSPAQRIFKEGRKPRSLDRPSLHALHFARIHQTLRVTPAMEAGVADRVWGLEEIANLLKWVHAHEGRIAGTTGQANRV